jgi:hypothetical protein
MVFSVLSARSLAGRCVHPSLTSSQIYKRLKEVFKQIVKRQIELVSPRVITSSAALLVSDEHSEFHFPEGG